MGKIKTNREFEQVAILIEEARMRAFQKVNEELVLLYFKVGGIVSIKVADGIWGENTVGELAVFVQNKFPGFSGFTRRGLYRMKQFYDTYSSTGFVTPLATQLEAYFAGTNENAKVSALPTQIQASKPGSKKVSTVPTQPGQFKVLQDQLVSSLLCKVTWSNHLEILSQTKSPEEKFFYLLHCIKERWSMRDLRRQLASGYFERTMLSNKKVSTVLTQLPQDLFKDPYIFEFLDLPDGHSETDLEKALTLNLQKFILEIGKGFTYMGTQYRLQVGNKDYYTDLLFYHRDLQCLVLFELKIQEFEPEFLGKLNFYLEALDRDVKRPFEKNSVGVLLCKGKDTEVVEYAMARNTSPAMIADYETKLIPKNVLAKKLHQLVEQLSKEETD
ncbi:PDDEXK nuclease domain-containing protein [Foetidibacter luteolus]|uniref:PDDEXK nuclease domain-containing protein n=1 Tax=Foetidibacter luteolus TaxID=2608880 RepID=UPI00129B661D|nr:PDDEXK nuclease domain-containing protein [Foetidibacter luteolus]